MGYDKSSSFRRVWLQRLLLPGSGDQVSLCSSALRSATHLLPFASFLRADLQLQSIILALIAELPQTAETASVLSELFPDPESLELETRDKLRRVLNERQASVSTDACQPSIHVDENTADTGINAGRCKTLAAVYYEKIRDHKRQLDKTQRAFGAYDEKLFLSGSVDTEKLLIGSRPYEYHADFLVCLDTFYSVSFGCCVESEGTRLPLIDAFSSEVCRAQLEHLPPKVTDRCKFKQNTSICCTPWAKSIAVKNPNIIKNAVRPLINPLPSKRRRFHRLSVSESELNACRNAAASLRRVLSQPTDVNVQTYDSGPDTVNAAGFCDADMEMENTNNNNSSGLQISLDFSLEADHSADICSDSSVSGSDRIKPARVDCPSESVLPPATVERLKFDGQLVETERVGEWMSRWAARHHADDNRARSSAIRVRVSPRLLAYSLWLVDNCRHFTPRVGDVTVAMVHGHAASVPREPPRTSAVVSNDSARNENASLRRDFQFSTCSTTSLVTSREAMPEDCVRRSKKGHSKKPKSARRDEVTSGVNQQRWSWETQTGSSHQQPTVPANRSANNNADRFHLLFSEYHNFFCRFLCLLSGVFSCHNLL